MRTRDEVQAEIDCLREEYDQECWVLASFMPGSDEYESARIAAEQISIDLDILEWELDYESE